MSGHFSSLLAADAHGGERIPVTVLTGFLGSGKTTLLNRLLQGPDLQGTVVIVNEFGAVGIDHDLIATAHDDTVLLPNGCLCCSVRGDLTEALLRLLDRDPASVRRVLIETSGLAEPAPILRTLMADATLQRRFQLQGVACTVDAVLGLRTLAHHSESVHQVAVADQLFLTKTDLTPAPADTEALRQRLLALNPAAPWHVDREQQPQALRALLMGAPATAMGDADTSRTAPAWRVISDVPAADPAPAHAAGMRALVLLRDEPLPRDAFFAWLDVLIASRGQDLLRVKGLVHLLEQPDQPLVVHGVQHLFQPPESLPAWPSADRRTRLVFIARDVALHTLEETLDVLVRRHSRRQRSPGRPAVPEF
jgi:G3E family GTPase